MHTSFRKCPVFSPELQSPTMNKRCHRKSILKAKRSLVIRRINSEEISPKSTPRAYVHQEVQDSSYSSGNESICRSISAMSLTSNTFIDDSGKRKGAFRKELSVKDKNMKDFDDGIPMDVDVSSDRSKLIESPVLAKEVQPSEELTKPSVHFPKKLKKNSYKALGSFIVCTTIFIGLLSIFYLYFYNIPRLITDEKIQELETILKKEVFEQVQATEAIISNFNDFGKWNNKSKVLAFVGSNGVGKTHVLNIIRKVFSTNSFDMYGRQLADELTQKKVIKALKKSKQKNCILLIDDLRRADVPQVISLLHILPNDKNVLVVATFNNQYIYDEFSITIDHDDVILINNLFNTSEAEYEIVEFHEFNADQVRSWVIQTLVNKFNKADIDKLVDKLLQNHNAQYKGLKGLLSKILLEIERT